MTIAEPACITRRSRFCSCGTKLDSFGAGYQRILTNRKMDVKSIDANATENMQYRARVPADSHRVPMVNEVTRRYEGSEICERGPIMDIALTKSAPREHAKGKKLGQAAIGELYLAGYMGILLPSPRKKLRPTVVTDKGKQLLEA